MTSDKKKFGFLRSLFWPVHRSECKNVLSLIILIFLLCIMYTVLRNLKDAIILTASHSGAEVIPFLKVWGMLPGAIFATWAYTRLRRRFSKETVFYIIISFFLSFFILFAFYLHPNSERLHLNHFGDFLSLHLPKGFSGLIAMIRNWTFTTFYIISELWATVMLGVLFWGFVNDHTEVSQAKRTYGILNIASNIAPVLGGILGVLFGKVFASYGSFSQTLEGLVIALTVLGIFSMITFYLINRNVNSQESKAQEIKAPKLSIRESIRYIAKSKYLASLALIVLGYNISINMTDVLWKEQLRKFFPTTNELLAHMNLITIGIGVVGTIGGTFFSMMVSRLGWTFTALLTPAVMTVMAIGFFIFLFFGASLDEFARLLFGVTPLALTAYFGSLQYALSKAGKYSVFDASKELAFLPLDGESKMKGKAAIDGLGSALGKSGASLTYQGLIIILGTVGACTPYIAAILAFVLIAWVISVFSLGKRFKEVAVPAK